MRWGLWLVLPVLSAWSPMALADRLWLWGEDAPYACEVQGHTPQHLTVQRDGEPVTLAWTRVRALEHDQPEATEAALRAGQDATLAAARLARGDAPGAMAVLAPHQDRYLGQHGPVSEAIASTLTRAALGRQDIAMGVRGWLAWVGAGEGIPGPSDQAGPSTMDPESGLIPILPPVFTPDQGVAVVGLLTLAARQMPEGSRQRTLADLYLAAARAATPPGPEVGAAPLTDARRVELLRQHPRDEGVMLVLDVVMAQAGDPAAQQAARLRLRDRMQRGGTTWAKAWAGLALGRSLAREADSRSRRLGAVESLDTAIRYGTQWPELGGLALADAAAHALASGDTRASTVLLDELKARYPGHAAEPTARKDDPPT